MRAARRRIALDGVHTVARVCPGELDAHGARTGAEVPQHVARAGREVREGGRAHEPLAQLPVVVVGRVGQPRRQGASTTGSAGRRTRRRRDAAEGWDGRPTMRPLRRGATPPARRGHRARRGGSRHTPPRRAARRPRDGASAPEVSTTSRAAGARRGTQQVEVSTDEGHDLGLLCAPSHPGPGEGDRRQAGVDPHSLRRPARSTSVEPMPDTRGSPLASTTARRPASRRSTSPRRGSRGEGHGTSSRPGRSSSIARWRSPPTTTSAVSTSRRSAAPNDSSPDAPTPTTSITAATLAPVGGPAGRPGCRRDRLRPATGEEFGASPERSRHCEPPLTRWKPGHLPSLVAPAGRVRSTTRARHPQEDPHGRRLERPHAPAGSRHLPLHGRRRLRRPGPRARAHRRVARGRGRARAGREGHREVDDGARARRGAAAAGGRGRLPLRLRPRRPDDVCRGVLPRRTRTTAPAGSDPRGTTRGAADRGDGGPRRRVARPRARPEARRNGLSARAARRARTAGCSMSTRSTSCTTTSSTCCSTPRRWGATPSSATGCR